MLEGKLHEQFLWGGAGNGPGIRAPRQSLTRQTALDELKTHLRSKTPELVRQKFYGLLMAHFAIRGLMHEAALRVDADPDRLSFVHSVRVVQRRLARFVVIPPSPEERLS